MMPVKMAIQGKNLWKSRHISKNSELYLVHVLVIELQAIRIAEVLDEVVVGWGYHESLLNCVKYHDDEDDDSQKPAVPRPKFLVAK